MKARNLVNQYVNMGKILKPISCSECRGNKKRIEGHHGDYAKPLEVVWLCTDCHAQAHKILNETKLLT